MKNGEFKDECGCCGGCRNLKHTAKTKLHQIKWTDRVQIKNMEQEIKKCENIS